MISYSMMFISTFINIFSFLKFHEGDIQTQRHDDPFVINLFIHS